MNRDEKHFARVMFKNKVLGYNGNEFEKLFSTVLKCKFASFQQVKPYGKEGDHKNDGFVPNEGLYFQVYAPEHLSIKESEAIKKLNVDFAGLVKKWDEICKINKFLFVVNDKYEGLPPNLTKHILDLNKKNASILIEAFTVAELEDYFMSLTEDQIISIIGLIPQPTNVSVLNFSILTEVIGHLLNKNNAHIDSNTLINVEFKEKLIFNKLSDYACGLLSSASYYTGDLSEFLKNNSSFSKESIKDRLVELYTEAIKQNTKQKSDLNFSFMLNEATKDLIKNNHENTKQIQDCIIALIAYFFESCDIFEKKEVKSK